MLLSRSHTDGGFHLTHTKEFLKTFNRKDFCLPLTTPSPPLGTEKRADTDLQSRLSTEHARKQTNRTSTKALSGPNAAVPDYAPMKYEVYQICNMHEILCPNVWMNLNGSSLANNLLWLGRKLVFLKLNVDENKH